MAKALYRNIGTNQMVWVPVGFFDSSPLWELVDGGGAGGEVTQAELDALEADTTGPHGVDDFSALETQDGATHKVEDGITTHNAASDPHFPDHPDAWWYAGFLLGVREVGRRVLQCDWYSGRTRPPSPGSLWRASKWAGGSALTLKTTRHELARRSLAR